MASSFFSILSRVAAADSSLMMRSIISSERSLQLMPMLMAVSCRSPVRTQTLMLASWRVWIVSGTPSWRRSSMAVAPRRKKSCSIISEALSSSSARLPPTVVAAFSPSTVSPSPLQSFPALPPFATSSVSSYSSTTTIRSPISSPSRPRLPGIFSSRLTSVPAAPASPPRPLASPPS
ncbi:hypothetical protein BN1708_017541 [Verticillium longisporum]|uniref:Uncharacterized protein n=1 Tax=Verticillium longisporum TaxID=100787 RepID=A0A0G4L4V8_VERLO|nr:hypothetical protein BN1708_017541 [Verticillium longisporum]